jgi:hypothetical protein
MNKQSHLEIVTLVVSFAMVANVGAAQSTGPDDAKVTENGNPAPEMQSVSVSAVKDPEIKSYRSMLAGLDAFEKHHALAPEAPEMRFVLSSLSDDPGLDFAHTKLSIRGDNVTIPVVIDAENGFVLPRSKQAEDDNADLILDIRKGKIRGRPDVRTPGIPANMRRLGDLRLECEVRSAIAKADMNFAFRGAIAAVTLGHGLCGSAQMRMGFFAGKNIRGITLVSNTRREPLTKFFGPNYFPPVGDRSWPDDTLVEFQFDHPNSSPEPHGPGSPSS